MPFHVSVASGVLRHVSAREGTTSGWEPTGADFLGSRATVSGGIVMTQKDHSGFGEALRGPGMQRCIPVLVLLPLLWVAGCRDVEPSSDTPEAHRAFLDRLAAPCGEAFRGGLVLEPEGDPMLTGTEELLVHFRDCEADEVRIPFHVEVEATGEWDRSRTWYVMRVDGGLELRHDHRRPDGSEDTRTWYGGFSVGEGSADRQDFASPERTEAAGVPVGWRIEIEPGSHYRYGTTFDGEYDWMIEFDLSESMSGEIPPAWGSDHPPSRIPGPP